ncbi:hypothetical protein [Jiella sp. M17.18]|uniref:hypothetical protein n=1 Tax=Jiella sp. M17.18 TaxID=3234247 RepID=UPI0034E04CA4
MRLYLPTAGLAAFALAAGLGAASAQQPATSGTPAPDTPLTQIPEVPAPGPRSSAPPAGSQNPMGDPCKAEPGGGGSGQTLSNKLSDCSGVLSPPSTSDPGIQAPAPDPEPNTTPVIPPNAVPDQPQPK